MRAAESFKSNFQKPSLWRLEIKGAKTAISSPFQDNYGDFVPFVAPSTTGKPENLGNNDRRGSSGFLLPTSLVPELPRGAAEVARRGLAGGWGKGEAKILALLP